MGNDSITRIESLLNIKYQTKGSLNLGRLAAPFGHFCIVINDDKQSG